MATIYRKTDKGQTEIETRLYKLLPRLRTALILVDGHRHDGELAKLIPGDPVASLQTLLADGFIEVVAVVEQRSPARPPPTESAPRPAAQAPASPIFDGRKREAIRVLNDHLGPEGESLAIRLEKAHDWAQLLPVLQSALVVLRNVRGAATAAEFARRFVDTPPG